MAFGLDGNSGGLGLGSLGLGGGFKLGSLGLGDPSNIVTYNMLELEASSSQYLTVADSADLDLGTTDFAIEAWVNWETVATANRIIGEGRGVNGSPHPLRKTGWSLIYNTNTLILSSYDGTTEISKTVSWTPAAGILYHIAVKREGNDLKFFIDGVQQGTTQDVTGLDFDRQEATGAYVGRLESGGAGPVVTYVDASIGFIRVYKNTTVSDADINTLYNSGTGLKYNSLGSLQSGVVISISPLQNITDTETTYVEQGSPVYSAKTMDAQ